METQTFRKFCPVCKLDNDANAAICQHCKTVLSVNNPEAVTTRRVKDTGDLTHEIRGQVKEGQAPPLVGMALFLLNSGSPIALRLEQEFILGRDGDSASEALVDLTSYDGFTSGVSRRHAIVKAVEDKYVLIDLNSSNGTWLNGKRILPNKPHDLPSGGVIQLGRLKLVVVYSHPPISQKA